MDIPSYTCQALRIGRTYDARNSTAGIDIFPSNIPTKTTNVNRYTFKYKKVNNSKDVRDLFEISGELSLKVKAGLVKVEGSGKYLSDSTRKEGAIEILAVLKYFTVDETMDGIVEVAKTVASGKIKHGLGTHYVRSVRYGVEMTASLSIQSSSASKTDKIQANVRGDIDIIHATVVDLKSQLKSLATQSSDETDIAIECYVTGVPEKLPTSLDDLVNLIEQFPSNLQHINEGKGVPLEFELLPINTAIQTAELPVSHILLPSAIEELEQCFDDVTDAQGRVNEYEESRAYTDDDDDSDVLDFREDITRVMGQFRDAISLMNSDDGKNKIDACLEAYRKALDGRYIAGKFCKKWRNILKTKKQVALPSSIKLPKGRPLTIALLGKTGNGKSATGNSIIGRDVFVESPGAKSVSPYCRFESRTDERHINVIDTPGIMDTKVIEKMDGKGVWLPQFKKDQERVLEEVAKVFAMAPCGFDAIALIVKYGCRFTAEDAQAFKLLHELLGKESEKHMFLILTFADQAKRLAENEKVPVDYKVKEWINTLPSWVQNFIQRIGEDRVLLFDNTSRKDADASKTQLSKFIQHIDKEMDGPFVHKRLTNPAKEELYKEIKKAMEKASLDQRKEELEKEKEEIESQLKNADLDENARKALERRRAEVEQRIEDSQAELTALINALKCKLAKSIEEGKCKILIGVIASMLLTEFVTRRRGGCFPGSATFVDKHGLHRKINSMHIGEVVQVSSNDKIRSEPVITFIHREPDLMQEFLKITTLKEGKSLTITQDHLLFVEKEGQVATIPARDVIIGDTVYVRDDHVALKKDAVQSISRVHEKGVYAPVTLSGTILVDDVHTSCYFDVLSHEWSHRAMGVARAVHHVSPWMLQWLSRVGEKDGFPGWCRLAHKMLTCLNFKNI